MNRTKEWFKIVDMKDGKVLTLFHGLDGSKTLPHSKWLIAKKEMVSDGKGTKYLSGFHVIPSREECIEYLKRFKNVKYKYILPVYVQDIRKKEHSPYNVWLADKIFIPKL